MALSVSPCLAIWCPLSLVPNKAYDSVVGVESAAVRVVYAVVVAARDLAVCQCQLARHDENIRPQSWFESVDVGSAAADGHVNHVNVGLCVVDSQRSRTVPSRGYRRVRRARLGPHESRFTLELETKSRVRRARHVVRQRVHVCVCLVAVGASLCTSCLVPIGNLACTCAAGAAAYYSMR